MRGERRFGLVKAALRDLFGQLRPRDSVALVTFSHDARLVLGPTNDRAALGTALDSVTPEETGSTTEGLEQAVRLAARSFHGAAGARLVLCCGGFPTAEDSWSRPVLVRIAGEVRQRFEISAVGVGATGDQVLEQLARMTSGAYNSADTREDVRRALMEALTGAPQTIAADAEVEVDFNPRVVRRHRLLGGEQGSASDASPGARMRTDRIAAGLSVTSLYEIELQDNPPDERVATLDLSYRPPGRYTYLRESRELRVAKIAGDWDAASPSLRLAAAAAEFADALRSPHGRGDALEAAYRRAQTALRDFPGRGDVAEFAALTGAALQARPFSPEAMTALRQSGPETVSVSVEEATDPVLERKVAPTYPDIARRAQVAGTVVLRARVSPAGDVEDVTVVSSIPALDHAAMAAVRRWKYSPSRINGRPVAAFVTIAVRFQLDE
jgi:Ca-activated chloride channel family protein